jgi:hypothetical protein
VIAHVHTILLRFCVLAVRASCSRIPTKSNVGYQRLPS